MDSRGSEPYGDDLSGYAEPRVGDLIEIQTAPAAGLTLRLKVVVRSHTKDGFGVQFVADTPDEKLELSLFRQFVRAAEGYTDA